MTLLIHPDQVTPFDRGNGVVGACLAVSSVQTQNAGNVPTTVASNTTVNRATDASASLPAA